MIPFPLSLLLLPAAALAGVLYVALERVRSDQARRFGRIAILAITWASPLASQGPGPAQLTLGLLVGYLGIRMVALRERWRLNRLPPSASQVFKAMVIPEELLVVAPAPAPTLWGSPAQPVKQRASLLLLRGLAAAAACVGLLVLGNQLRIWQWSRALDDLLVLAEVAVGTMGVHQIIVGSAGLAGRQVLGLQDQPILSASLCQFWARRWNRLVQANLDRGFFRPYGRRRQWALGTLTAFTASGMMHVIAVLDTERPALTLAPSVAVMAFFLIHGALVLAERRLGWHRQPQKASALMLARMRTIALFALLSPLLLDPFANVVHVHGRTLNSWGTHEGQPRL
ncbi:MAG: hypothetical protein H7X95_09305 [Deltaproteobacteria bacterium]|nr:hypothetical protein [Deltaproteobacteria bacterium]